MANGKKLPVRVTGRPPTPEKSWQSSRRNKIALQRERKTGAMDDSTRVDDLPRRMRPADCTAQKRPLRPTLDRVDAFTREHPHVSIAAPYNTASGLWEVRVRGAADSQWDNGRMMMDDLEARYP